MTRSSRRTADEMRYVRAPSTGTPASWAPSVALLAIRMEPTRPKRRMYRWYTLPPPPCEGVGRDLSKNSSLIAVLEGAEYSPASHPSLSTRGRERCSALAELRHPNIPVDADAHEVQRPVAGAG